MSAQRDMAVDATKGALILLIILGHNTIILRNVDGLRQFLYNWHVYAFFLVAFMLPVRRYDWRSLLDRLTRYYVPFLVFFLLTTILALAVGGLQAWPQRLTAFVNGYLIGSAYWTESASGARYFWFLPALAGLTLLRYAGRWAIDARVPRALVALTALASFLLAGLTPEEVLRWTPFALPIALYLVLPCLAFVALWRWLDQAYQKQPGTTLAGVAATAAILNAMAIISGSTLILASLQVYSVAQPVELLLHAAIPIVNCAFLILLFRTGAGAKVFAFFGNHSLLIFLSHQIFFVALTRVMRAADVPPSLAAGLVVYGVVVAGSTLLAFVIAGIPILQRLIIPRTWNEWRDTLHWGRNTRKSPDSAAAEN